MLNKSQHQLVMGQILKNIYTDTTIAPLLGFKGGTCAYLFYNLPRFSVDLDFDLLATKTHTPNQIVFDKIKNILTKYGAIKDAYIKRSTIFALVSYGNTDHNIKIEINTRLLLPDLRKHYEIKELLGIPMLVAKPDYLFAGKLAALTGRRVAAMRDIYDLYFFAHQRWAINLELITALTGRSTADQLTACITTIETIKDNQILHGLGELLDDKEKRWVKEQLKTEVIFLLKNYLSVLK